MKILFHSNSPWAYTGYGQQTALFVPRIGAQGHDVAISSVWGLEGASMTWEGFRVYPADGAFGNRTLATWALHHSDGNLRDCQVITLIDVWPLTFDGLRMLNLASWVPVDSEPTPIGVVDYFHKTGALPIAMSRFGETQLRESGLEPLYVPHGVDTKVYTPLPDDERNSFREAMDIPDGGFLVGMVANNQGNAPCRKAFPEAIAAFARFRRQHPDAFLYLHAERTGIKDGVNLDHLLALHGVPEHAVRFVSPFMLEYGLPAEGMQLIYNALDVLLSPSLGEGFGVPIIEAQACGVPVIVGGWTSMPELCGAGWRVEGQPIWIEGGRIGVAQRSYQFIPTVDSIVEKLELAHAEAAGLRTQAADFAQAYDADVVAETYWRPVLAQLEERRRREAELPEVGLNRKQRRAGKKKRARAA